MGTGNISSGKLIVLKEDARQLKEDSFLESGWEVRLMSMGKGTKGRLFNNTRKVKAGETP